MLEPLAPCTTHPWSPPAPPSSRPPPTSPPSPTPPATPCQRQWPRLNLQATLGGLTLEARWEQDPKVENYLQVRMTFITQVMKKTGNKIPTLLNFQTSTIFKLKEHGGTFEGACTRFNPINLTRHPRLLDTSRRRMYLYLYLSLHSYISTLLLPLQVL